MSKESFIKKGIINGESFNILKYLDYYFIKFEKWSMLKSLRESLKFISVLDS